MHEDKFYVSNALKAGALAYVLKVAPSDEIIKAINSVLEDRLYVSPVIAGEMLGSYVLGQGADAFDTLSPREIEVLKLISGGDRCKDIAEKLFLSESTVKKHRHNLMTKLDVHGTADLVRIAINKNLIEG